MLEAHLLTKRFGGIEVLRQVSFRVSRGETLGYLGPNGSGKSTTFKIIAGLLEPSAGHVTFDGRSIDDDRPGFHRLLGYVPEEPHLYTHLTAIEYLRLVAMLRDLPADRLERRMEALLVFFDLTHAAHGRLGEFSKGMRQRVLLAASLLHDPEVLILDEPFSGLDVSAGLMLKALVEALRFRGKILVLSSHRLDVIETLCPRVVILHQGEIVAAGAPADLRAARRSASLEAVFAAVTQQDDYPARAHELLEAVSR